MHYCVAGPPCRGGRVGMKKNNSAGVHRTAGTVARGAADGRRWKINRVDRQLVVHVRFNIP